ncbi:hypothetical protein [Roseimicrobium sp. ORNL1]|uniref:hypothetical protein n=1 Tax=Roseimicrobium sp. ORNL1 TaxID=2711231 RepID=UPI0019802E0D|nr:hypothetical protein [Roseimicrobium sp. ORNL1]
MASKAKSRRTKLQARKCTATRMCSISSTGVVFLNARALEVSSEITLTVQTNILGSGQEWTVQGWVVECVPAEEPQNCFKVTLLFSNLPKELQQVLTLAEGCHGATAIRRIPGAELFGLN